MSTLEKTFFEWINDLPAQNSKHLEYLLMTSYYFLLVFLIYITYVIAILLYI